MNKYQQPQPNLSAVNCCLLKAAANNRRLILPPKPATTYHQPQLIRITTPAHLRPKPTAWYFY